MRGSDTGLEALWPVILAGISLFSVVGIFVPRWRMRWKSTPYLLGPISCAGFSLVFGTGAMLLLSFPRSLWLLAVIGFILVVVGYAIDTNKL